MRAKPVRPIQERVDEAEATRFVMVADALSSLRADTRASRMYITEIVDAIH